jgi:hypothetical protein
MANLLPRRWFTPVSAYRSPRLATLRSKVCTARLVNPAVGLVAVALTAVTQPHLFLPETLVSLDTASQYYAWYAFLGQNLLHGHIPGWNAATFSGTPFAANPLSGWTYLPAMVLFALLPLAEAVRAYLWFHMFLAAGGANA